MFNNVLVLRSWKIQEIIKFFAEIVTFILKVKKKINIFVKCSWYDHVKIQTMIKFFEEVVPTNTCILSQKICDNIMKILNRKFKVQTHR